MPYLVSKFGLHHEVTMHSFGFPTVPISDFRLVSASHHLETTCCRVSYTSSAIPSSFPSTASVGFSDVKLPARISETLSGPPRGTGSNVKPKHAIEATARRTLLSQLCWKQALATHRAEFEPGSDEVPRDEQEGNGPSDIADGSDVGLHAADEDVVDPGLLELQRVFAAPVEHIKESWNQVSELSRLQGETTRRRVLGAPMFMSLACVFGCITREDSAHALVHALIDSSKAPTNPFDATDERLRDAAFTFEQALNASTVDEEERLWTSVIDKYGMLKAEWVPDIISRAYGNRGNARSRQGNMEQALEDYDKSITLAPYAVDPVLNRGVVLESLGRYEEASADYEAVLHAQPNDPAAWNNLGNVKAAQNKWDRALIDYNRAVQLAPEFSFAAANYALALYQVGRENEAMKQFRALLRKYPEFPDMRAALAVSLYAEGLVAEAENNWGRLEMSRKGVSRDEAGCKSHADFGGADYLSQDGRYKDRSWVRNTRRWPPRLANALESFLDVKGSVSSNSNIS